jgi:hypothetical protein
MYLTSSNSLTYNFIVRFFFSTNHKCGVLDSFILGGYKLYRKAVTVKPKVTRLKFSKGVKRTFSVDVFLSLGKRISIMISPFGGAGLVNPDSVQPGHRNNLPCGANWLPMTQGKMYDVGLSVVRSQGLEEIQVNCGQVKYDYKGGIASFGLHLGKYGKPKSLRGFDRNVVLLSNAKRGFSTGESCCFEKLRMYKGKYVNLIEVIADVDFLQGAYQRIKFKGSSDKMLGDFGNKWFKSTYEKLLKGSFRFRPAKKWIIPKSNKSGPRLLTIIDWRDKIVQQAMKIVLERVYEPLFLDISHGYRSSRSCHSALESIRMTWTGISWFLEFGVEKCYDNIDRHRLTSILKEEINDQRFIDLIFKLLNAGMI